ncbi:MAG: TraR/DksA family transcriptional regulator [Nitrospirota bacterium]
MAAKAKKPKKKKGNKYEEIKIELEKQKINLLAEAGVIISEGINPGNITFPDLSDQATAEMDQNFLLRLREREQKLLKKIDDALERIIDGSFGICEECEKEIEYQRLAVRPVATLCISCKTQQEEEEKIREQAV